MVNTRERRVGARGGNSRREIEAGGAPYQGVVLEL